MTTPTMLIVDDYSLNVDLVANVGKAAGFDVCETTSALQFQQAWRDSPPSVIVMDIVMPDMDGIELLTWLSEQDCVAPIILMSGYDGKYLEMADVLATRKGITIIGTLAKPFDTNDLTMMLEQVTQ